jgi:LmbE family N-acetylglucosaminyl deacetylase
VTRLFADVLDLTIGQVARVLCLGAHSDDLEIGCGGTIRRLVQAYPRVEVRWQVFSAPGPRRREAQRSAKELLTGSKGARIEIRDFRESYFPEEWGAIKDVFEKTKKQFEPDLIFTHWRDDRHQDHRVLSDLAWNTFRNHTILEYEIPKYDGDLGNPNIYVALDAELCQQKIAAILRHFRTQATRHWFTQETFLGLMRLRGIECGPRAGYAEAFYGRKLVI